MKILIADDSSTMRRILINILEEAGFADVVEACDGEEALGQIEVHSPDLVLLDWNMPNLNGLDTLKRIRDREATRTLPVIMVTSEAEKTHVLAAIQAGANNYVVKPFTPDTIREKVESACTG
jgi:two-component system chemotaxis response regulator CheY